MKAVECIVRCQDCNTELYRPGGCGPLEADSCSCGGNVVLVSADPAYIKAFLSRIRKPDRTCTVMVRKSLSDDHGRTVVMLAACGAPASKIEGATAYCRRHAGNGRNR